MSKVQNRAFPFRGTDRPKKTSTVFAVDESGDPIFYDKKKRFIAGNDAYLNFILDKVKLVADIYDFNKPHWEDRYYNHKTNKFSTKKISPVGLGAGVLSVPHRNGGRSPSQD
jgi:hypothetical protein